MILDASVVPLVVSFHAGDNSGKYQCRIILRGSGSGSSSASSSGGPAGDVRVFRLCCTVMPPGNKATIDFTSPVNTAVLQNIPIVSLLCCQDFNAKYTKPHN